MARLLDALRDQLNLTGIKEGCGEGECGACSIEMDGRLVNSCLVPVLQAEGAAIRTIEGVANGEQLHAVQQAFIAHGGAQCGICTPGMILAAVNLLDHNSHPTEGDVRIALAGNLCRCTGYTKIFRIRVARGRGDSGARLRSAVASFELRTPQNLAAALEIMAREPGEWRPFAGGTDLMVLLEAGKLTHRRYLNIWNCGEFRNIASANESEMAIGSDRNLYRYAAAILSSPKRI